MSRKRYLITGGTGFLGSALVRRLLEKGHFVRVLDNNSRGNNRRLFGLEKELDFIEADIRNSESVNKACIGIDCVVHLAYINGTEFFYSKPELILDIAVKGMMNVLDGCIANGVKELILASSSEVYQAPDKIPTDENVALSVPNPLNPRYSYGGGKIISELMAINYGRKYFEKVIIFRPHNVYGPDMGWEHVIPQFIMKMCELIKNSDGGIINFPIQGSGQETRAFIFVDDFISGLNLLLEKGKHMEIYNIGNDEEIKIIDAAKGLAKYFNKEINILPEKLQEGSVLRRCPDITKIRNLGYESNVSFEEGLVITANWYRNNLNLKK